MTVIDVTFPKVSTNVKMVIPLCIGEQLWRMMGTRYRGYLNIPKDDLTITEEVLGTGTTSKVSWSRVQTLFGKIEKGCDNTPYTGMSQKGHAITCCCFL